tara:strand:- start:629 stop:808 length:180 start_codon:yes stop_codon:yes gene_type:complete
MKYLILLVALTLTACGTVEEEPKGVIEAYIEAEPVAAIEAVAEANEEKVSESVDTTPEV